MTVESLNLIVSHQQLKVRVLPLFSILEKLDSENKTKMIVLMGNSSGFQKLILFYSTYMQ